MTSDGSDFDAEWDEALFSVSMPRVSRSELPDDDDWEARYNEDTTGYVPDPLSTSFTDLDLGPALLSLQQSKNWVDLEAWSQHD